MITEDTTLKSPVETESRIEQWKRKLLDLSLRNPLLNTRNTSKYLLLEEGTIYGQISDTRAIVPYNSPQAGEDFLFRTNLSKKELKERLRELYTTSRAMYEDSGVNSLFVAVGNLNWNEEDGGAFHRAPLMLVPAALIRTTGPIGFRLVRTEEDAVVNFCLLELLRSQFKIPVPAMAGEHFDDGDPDCQTVYRILSETIRSRNEWYLTTDIAFGIFAFDKVVLWRDISDYKDIISRHFLIEHLIERKGIFDDGVKLFPPEELEKHIDYARLYCPLSTDASQTAAILYSALGKTFVLHGPPGTGKSQTIANMIVHNLVLGRKILFVSEKKAALDVVYKRLSVAGFAPFCLELHSNKSQKTSVMRQFAEAFDVLRKSSSVPWTGVCSDLSALTEELGAFVKALHCKATNGRSVYDCMDRVAGKHPASSEDLIDADVVSMSPTEVEALAKEVKELGEAWKVVDREDFAALAPLKTIDWNPNKEATLRNFFAQIESLAAGCRTWVDRFKAMWTSFVVRRYVSLPMFAPPESWLDRIQTLRNHLDGLRLTMAYRTKADRLRRLGCRGFVAGLENGDFGDDDVVKVFEEVVALKTLNQTIANSPLLTGFSGLRQQEKIVRLRELEGRYREAVREYAFATLSKSLPNVDELSPEDKKRYALLKHESAKKKRMMPIRELIAKTMPVANQMKPCFLMSPLSVAQYLPAEIGLFDLVIFDEASQMTVWDAVGAIARGKQFVCVGDPKQLPPTTFFVKGDAPEDDPDVNAEILDLESILDECLANGLYSAYLNWHYRSRHESLIAFSNRKYYEDRLNTFPAAVSNDRLGVSFRYVNGAPYDHVSHTNEKEAKALVDYFFRRLQDREERERSWGVVTFSVAQKKLIERMIDQRAGECDWAKEFFDDSKPDAFFVKNLENVQGDERDAIIFSIAYAPDADGNFAMMFGPINHPGGERRLNVAITRAREQVIIFSSAHSSDIHAERTNSVGVRHLKELMVYAETGKLEGDGVCPQTFNKESLMGEVRQFLESHGYQVDERVGRSMVPIDLAVRDPSGCNRYVLAIEFDGKSYVAQKTVLDRELLREDVLRNLGWNYFRMWSIDWTFDRKRTEQRLLAALPKIV